MQQEPVSVVHRIMYFRPIAGDEYEEKHGTGEAGEPARHLTDATTPPASIPQTP